jgi:hypothetical protein
MTTGQLRESLSTRSGSFPLRNLSARLARDTGAQAMPLSRIRKRRDALTFFWQCHRSPAARDRARLRSSAPQAYDSHRVAYRRACAEHKDVPLKILVSVVRFRPWPPLSHQALAKPAISAEVSAAPVSDTFLAVDARGTLTARASAGAVPRPDR